MLRVAYLGSLACLIAVTVSAVEPGQVQMAGAQYVGAAGCKSSSCHGGAGEKRSQYITWLRQDVHTRGFATLTTARSERIVGGLAQISPGGDTAPAASNARCTTCHSPFQSIPAARRLSAAETTESISCESCHGAAADWWRSHTRPDWTYATRVGAGMRDLKSLYVRANTCVACHQNIDAALTAAGHPDLIFELDAQTLAEPKHWRDPVGSGTRAWLVGQAVALREASWKLAQNPEANQQTLEQWHGLAWLLARVSSTDSGLAAIPLPTGESDAASFAHTQMQADSIARRAARQNLDAAFLRRLRLALAGTSDDFRVTSGISREILFRRAQRLVLALEALDADDHALVEHTENLRKDVESPLNFDPAQVAAHLVQLRQSLAP